MATLLDGQVTRPSSFDLRKNYAAIVARGENGGWLGDFDVNDLQRILRTDVALLARTLLREGAILYETGGSIAAAVPGVNLGTDALSSAGTYLGVENQLYTVTLVTGGTPAVLDPEGAVLAGATYKWRSTGSDNPQFGAAALPVTAIAPDVATALADPATYGHPVGTQGIVIFFINPNGFVTGGNTWIVQVTYGARPPLVVGTTITIYDVLVYVAGRLHRVAGQTLTYPVLASGISLVYAEWTRRYVTEAEDPDLRDPYSDTPEAARELWDIALRTTDTSTLPLGANEFERRVFPLYFWDRATNEVRKAIEKPYAINLDLTEGALDARRLLNVDQNEFLRGFAAVRDVGAHGSYVIEPLSPAPRASRSTNPASNPATKIRIAISAPVVVSVEGLRIVQRDPVELEVDQALEFGTVLNEPHTYVTGTDRYRLAKAGGGHPLPIKAITRVAANVQIGTVGVGSYEQRTRGAGQLDALSKKPNVLAVLEVSSLQGGGGTIYTQGTLAGGVVTGGQFALANGGDIQWAVGQGPAPGVSYYVAYTYRKTMVANTDYQLVAGEIDFSPAGDNPVAATSYDVDYQPYLPRIDVIVIRPTGAFAIVRGVAAEEPLIPTLPVLTLPYVRVEISANDVNVRIRKFPNDRVTFEEINAMRDALDELTRDFALQDLLNQARMQTSARLVDIFAEDFSTLDQADLGFNVAGTLFDATIRTEEPEVTLPFTSTLYAPTRVASGLPGGETAVRVGRDFFTLPFTDELAIDVAAYSDSYPVNPYADFTPEPPQVIPSPDQDYFSDVATVAGPSLVDAVLKTQLLRLGIISMAQIQQFRRDFRAQNGRAPNRGEIIGQISGGIETRVAEIAARYMRQIPVTLTGLFFVPGEKLRVKFGGKDVALTPDAPTVAGGDIYTVLANVSTVDVNLDPERQHGDFTAHFTIPAQVPAGTAAIEVYGDQLFPGSVWPTNYTVRARATFTSEGAIRQTITQERITNVILEPIAQSIVFPAMRMISKVDIPLAEKPANGDPPLLFQVRATDRSGEASTPSDVVLETLTREAIDCNVGVNSSNAFTPGDPVLCLPDEFRALCLRSVSNGYHAYVAILSAPNRVAGGYVDHQAITGGIFMDSANDRDWTLRQGWDLRLKLWVAKMSATDARVYFSRITQTDITAFVVNADQAIPDGTGITWHYAVDGKALTDGTKTWVQFVPLVETELSAVAATLDIRAILTTTDLYVTPGIHAANLSVLIKSNKATLTYVGRQKPLAQPATMLKGSVELLVPTGTSTIALSSNDGVTWVTAALEDGGDVLADGFTRVQFSATVGSGQLLRARLGATTTDKAKRPRGRNLYVYAEPA